jgi:hypothetical protein
MRRIDDQVRAISTSSWFAAILLVKKTETDEKDFHTAISAIDLSVHQK